MSESKQRPDWKQFVERVQNAHHENSGGDKTDACGLVARLRQGDTEAERDFYFRYADHLRVVMAGRLRQSQLKRVLDASELGNLVLKSAMSYLRQMPAQKAQKLNSQRVDQIVHCVASRKWFSQIRCWLHRIDSERHNDDATPQPQDLGDDPLDACLSSALWELLEKKIPPDDRVYLKILLERKEKFSELGKEWGVPEDTARMRLNRARNRIRTLLEPLLVEDAEYE